MNYGQTYKIVSKKNPAVEIFGTFVCPAFWQNSDDFDKLLDVINQKFIETCETDYEDKTEEADQDEEDKMQYISEQIMEVYEGIEHDDMIFSNVECNNELFKEYYRNPEDMFPNCWVFSEDEFDFIEMPAPEFKNACSDDCGDN